MMNSKVWAWKLWIKINNFRASPRIPWFLQKKCSGNTVRVIQLHRMCEMLCIFYVFSSYLHTKPHSYPVTPFDIAVVLVVAVVLLVLFIQPMEVSKQMLIFHKAGYFAVSCKKFVCIVAL